MIGEATISEDGLYRYELTRRWSNTQTLSSRTLTWVMLNPSTADAELDDPTIRRCIRFSKDWDFDALVVVNLFALRATKPVHLNHHPDPVGPKNDLLAGYWMRNTVVVAAWGAHKKAAERTNWFWDQTASSHYKPLCLGLTNGGNPRHPLFVAADTKPMRFQHAAVAP